MQDYDVTLKLLFRNSPRVLFQELAGTSINTWLDTELPRVQNPRADLVGDAADGSIVHFELQSTNDPRMPIRMSGYCVDIRDIHGKLPRQFVVYIGKAPVAMETQLAGPDFLCRYTVFDLRELDGEKLLASPSLADNVIAILARLRDHKEAVRVIIGRIAQLEGEARQDVLGQLLIVAGLRNLAAEVEAEARKVPFIIDIMENEVLGREYKRGRDEGKVEGIAEGEAKGKAEGKAQGIAEGELEGERRIFRRLVEKRFGTLPASIDDAIAACDTNRLEALTLRVLDVATIDELFQ